MFRFTWLTPGTFQGAAGAAPKGGAAYYLRRKRFMTYILTCFLLALVL